MAWHLHWLCGYQLQDVENDGIFTPPPQRLEGCLDAAGTGAVDVIPLHNGALIESHAQNLYLTNIPHLPFPILLRRPISSASVNILWKVGSRAVWPLLHALLPAWKLRCQNLRNEYRNWLFIARTFLALFVVGSGQ